MSTTQFIKHLIGPHWPRNKPISNHDIFNVKVKVMCIAPLYSHSIENYIAFHKSVALWDFMKGIDNQPAMTDEKA